MNIRLKRLIALVLVAGTVNVGGVYASAATNDADVNNEIEDIYVQSNEDLMKLVDMNSFKVSQTEAKPGDVVNISFKVKEKINFGFIQFIKPISRRNETVNISYNEETGLYEGKVEINDKSECGQWKMTRMYLRTEAGVEGEIFDKNRVLATSGVDFSVADFKVSDTKVICKDDLDIQESSNLGIDISEFKSEAFKFSEVELSPSVKIDVSKLSIDETPLQRVPAQSLDPEVQKRLEDAAKKLISQKENQLPKTIILSPEMQENIKNKILQNTSNPNKGNPMSSEELKKAMDDFIKGNN